MTVTEHGDGMGSVSTSFSGGTGFKPRLLAIMTIRMVLCRRLKRLECLQANVEAVPRIRSASVPSAKRPGRFTPGNETSHIQWLEG
jgi:hypothetical protein